MMLIVHISHVSHPHQSDLKGVNFSCRTQVSGECVCAYPTSTPATCTVSGQDVLTYLDIGSVSYGKWATIIIGITIIYRIA